MLRRITVLFALILVAVMAIAPVAVAKKPIVGDLALDFTGPFNPTWTGTLSIDGSPDDIEFHKTGTGKSLGDDRGEWMQLDDGSWEFQGPPGAPDFDGWPLGDGWIQPPLGATGPVGTEQLTGSCYTIARTWYQPHDGAPIAFDITDMAIPAEVCGGNETFLSSNTVVTSSAGADCDGRLEAWILTFVDIPA